MRRHTFVGRVLIPTGLVLLSGCFGLFGNRPGQSGLNRKPVSRKEAPTSLIAIDNTRCLVTEEKFRNTPVGASVTCYWTSDREGRVVTGGGAQNSDAPQREVSGKITEATAKGAAAAPRAKKPND